MKHFTHNSRELNPKQISRKSTCESDWEWEQWESVAFTENKKNKQTSVQFHAQAQSNMRKWAAFQQISHERCHAAPLVLLSSDGHPPSRLQQQSLRCRKLSTWYLLARRLSSMWLLGRAAFLFRRKGRCMTVFWSINEYTSRISNFASARCMLFSQSRNWATLFTLVAL